MIKLKLGAVGGGRGAFIEVVHRIVARIDCSNAQAASRMKIKKLTSSSS